MKKTRVASLTLAILLSSPAPAQETRIRVSEHELLRVFVTGRGQPVVLVPGLFGSAFGFRKLIDPLVELGYRVIVVEPLGVGASSTPAASDYSLTAQAERLAAVLAGLEPEPVVVVAHAVSASIALRLAWRHPERVRAIVSLDGGAAEAAATPGFRRAMRFAFLIKLLGGRARLRQTVRSTLVERSANPGWVTDEVVDGYMSAAARDMDGTLRAYRQMARANEPQLLLPRLAEVRCPVRLVLGEAPRIGGVSEAEIRVLAQGLPSFTVERVPGAGHFVFEEAPQAVIAAIERSSDRGRRLAAIGTR
jgi:haloalkane dehalogenase